MIFPKTDSCKELSVFLPKKINHGKSQASNYPPIKNKLMKKPIILQLKIIFKNHKQNIYSHDFDLLNTPAPCKEHSSLADL